MLRTGLEAKYLYLRNLLIAKDNKICCVVYFQRDYSEAQEGDPKYLAPELLEGKFSKAADIFR